MKELTETHLTDEHVDRLLDMCKEYFPEYDSKQMFQMPVNSTEKLRFGRVFFYKPRTEFVASIHWYELCLTYLFDRIMGDNINIHNQSKYDYHWNRFIQTLRSEGHPIDYLYRLSKAIKN